jgi:hypothetical protein
MDVAVARFNVTLSLITGEGTRLGVIEPEQNLQTMA